MEIAQQCITKWIAAGRPERVLDLSHLDLTLLPPLPSNLQKLDCSYNKLTSLPSLICAPIFKSSIVPTIN